MKFVASVTALLLALWITVKLGLLAYHGLQHLLHLVIGVVPFALGAVGMCALGALGYAIVAWWIRRRKMPAQRKARRGGAGRGSVAACFTAKPIPSAAPAGVRPAWPGVVTGAAGPPAWKPSTKRAGGSTAVPASSLPQGALPAATSQRSAPRPARSLPNAAAVGPHRRADGGKAPFKGTAPIVPNAHPVGPPTRPVRRLIPAMPAAAQRPSPTAPELPLKPVPGGLERVILIERCGGVQVGRNNDQYSTYRVSLSAAALQSSQALADQLLSRDVPWSRDVFGHNARPAPGGPVGGFGASSRGLLVSPDGNTLVIVRNSRGVQVGNHNVQHNEFRIRVTDVTVRASGLGMTAARRDAISRLHANPDDWVAARALAEDVARAARHELTVDLTAKLARDVGRPDVGWSPAVRDRTGIQAGDHNRARVTIKVAVSRLDTHKLAGQIHRSAQTRARMTATRETASRPAPHGLSRPGPASTGPAAPQPGRGMGISL